MGLSILDGRIGLWLLLLHGDEGEFFLEIVCGLLSLVSNAGAL